MVGESAIGAPAAQESSIIDEIIGSSHPKEASQKEGNTVAVKNRIIPGNP